MATTARLLSFALSGHLRLPSRRVEWTVQVFIWDASLACTLCQDGTPITATQPLCCITAQSCRHCLITGITDVISISVKLSYSSQCQLVYCTDLSLAIAGFGTALSLPLTIHSDLIRQFSFHTFLGNTCSQLSLVEL